LDLSDLQIYYYYIYPLDPKLSRDACYEYAKESGKGFLALSDCAVTLVQGSKYSYHFEVAPTVGAHRHTRDLQLRADTPEEMEVRRWREMERWKGGDGGEEMKGGGGVTMGWRGGDGGEEWNGVYMFYVEGNH
jgi:hypothetical protein